MPKKYVIVDIDGTISKVGDRLKYLNMSPPDWDSFYNDCFEDEPIEEIIDLVSFLSHKYTIVFCTGRRESARQKTYSWITKYFGIPFTMTYQDLVMRENGDERHDTEIKPEGLRAVGIGFSQIAFILEDRNSMVKKWRELGIKCLQVAEGDF